jgi:hypothetical protein
MTFGTFNSGFVRQPVHQPGGNSRRTHTLFGECIGDYPLVES